MQPLSNALASASNNIVSDSSVVALSTTFPTIMRAENTANAPYLTAMLTENIASTNNQVINTLSNQGSDSSLSNETVQLNQLQNIMETMTKSEQWVSFDECFQKFKPEQYAEAYHSAQLQINALGARTAWINIKTKMLQLLRLNAEPKPDSGAIRRETSMLEKNFVTMIDKALAHQKILERVESKQNHILPVDTQLEPNVEPAKLYKKSRHRARGANTTAHLRYIRLMSEPMAVKVTEAKITEKLVDFFCKQEVAALIQPRFFALSIDDIKQTISSVLARLTSTSNAPQSTVGIVETQFKLQRPAVCEEFWENLRLELSEFQFNQAFLQFILTSWKSDKTRMLAMEHCIEKAIKDGDVNLQCQLLTEKCFRQGMYQTARGIVQGILDYEKYHRQLSTGIKTSERLEKLHTATVDASIQINHHFGEVFEKLYLPYLDRINKNWSEVDDKSKHALLAEFAIQANSYRVLTFMDCHIGKISSPLVPKRLMFINKILEQLKETGSVSLEKMQGSLQEVLEQTAGKIEIDFDTLLAPATSRSILSLQSSTTSAVSFSVAQSEADNGSSGFQVNSNVLSMFEAVLESIEPAHLINDHDNAPLSSQGRAIPEKRPRAPEMDTVLALSPKRQVAIEGASLDMINQLLTTMFEQAQEDVSQPQQTDAASASNSVQFSAPFSVNLQQDLEIISRPQYSLPQGADED